MECKRSIRRTCLFLHVTNVQEVSHELVGAVDDGAPNFIISPHGRNMDCCYSSSQTFFVINQLNVRFIGYFLSEEKRCRSAANTCEIKSYSLNYVCSFAITPPPIIATFFSPPINSTKSKENVKNVVKTIF